MLLHSQEPVLDNLRGIIFMVLAMAGFAIEDAFIKTVADQIPPGQILMIIGGLGGMVLWGIAALQGIPVWTKTFWMRPVLIRNLTEVVGTLGFVKAITSIPLSVASTIAQAMPLVITMGAALIFKEAVGWRRWSAIGVGLCGVLIIMRPGFEGFDPNALWAVLAVFGLGGRDLASRAVPRQVPNTLLTAYGFFMLVPTGAILLAFSGGACTPTTQSWLMLAAAISVGILAYYAITLASRIGEVSVISPFRYTRIVFALILGITIFGERPDLLTYVGMALIVASGIYTVLRERRLKKRQR